MPRHQNQKPLSSISILLNSTELVGSDVSHVELGHRQSACPSRNRRGLLLDTTGRDVEVIYDESPQDYAKELEADEGSLLMIRQTCLTPRIT